MKTYILNLTSLDKSDIKYKISKFPDGQQQVTIEQYPSLVMLANFKVPIEIKSRLNNFLDLELIACSVASLRNLKVKEIHLYVPYFEGSRSDRKFEEGSNNYLKQVICPFVNNLKFESITVWDAHSDVLEACLNNFDKIDNFELVRWAITDLYKDSTKNQYVLISPDAGANKKVYKLAEQLEYKQEIITCTKIRNTEGKITHTEVPLHIAHGDFEDRDLLIVDDICDGGRTFIEIAKAAKENKKFIGKIYLVITHGIFSAGFDQLADNFNGIYCTNSYKDLDPSEWYFNLNKPFVKQMEIF
jgi:ribose-phosphate pyrophosphokinase